MNNRRTSAELQVLRNSLNLSDGDLARMFKVNITTIKSWLKPKRYSGGKYYVNFVPKDIIDTLSKLKEQVERQAWDLRDFIDEDFMPFIEEFDNDANDDIYSEPVNLIIYSKEDYKKYALDTKICATHKIYFAMIMMCKVLLEIPFRYVRVIYFEPNDYFQYITDTKQKDCEDARYLWAYYFSSSLSYENHNIGDSTNIESIATNGINNIKKDAFKDNDTYLEVSKVEKRIPKWFRNPNQYNSVILRGFIELSKIYTVVTPSLLQNHCRSIRDFTGNYNQMKNFGEKNHGKVFDETNGIITLWNPVKKFILNEYNKAQL